MKKWICGWIFSVCMLLALAGAANAVTTSNPTNDPAETVDDLAIEVKGYTLLSGIKGSYVDLAQSGTLGDAREALATYMGMQEEEIADLLAHPSDYRQIQLGVTVHEAEGSSIRSAYDSAVVPSQDDGSGKKVWLGRTMSGGPLDQAMLSTAPKSPAWLDVLIRHKGMSDQEALDYLLNLQLEVYYHMDGKPYKAEVRFAGDWKEHEKVFPAEVTAVDMSKPLPFAAYHEITAEQAHNKMTSGEPLTLLDVRVQTEFDEKHIPGATLLPLEELSARAAADLPDRTATIYLYCNGGGKSAIGAQALAEKGYTQVYVFGGIKDWPYETEKGTGK